MANALAVAFGFLIIGLVLAAVLGAVERREKYAFVAGVVLVVVGPVLVASLSLPAAVGGVIALAGFLAIVASTVPLLRESPAAT